MNAALRRLRPHLRAPLSHWRPEAVEGPPQETTGALVIWDVETLDRTRQEQLLTWLESHAASVQVISVAARPLFPLVLNDEFLDALYYRLNGVCLALATL